MKHRSPSAIKEKIISSTTAYQGSVVSVEEKSIDFGNGNKRVFETISWNVITGVSALPLLDDKTVMLLEHFQAGIESTCLSLPTGGLAVGEDPKERMNLELQEELGYRSQELTLMFRSHVLPGYIGSEAGYVYVAKRLTPSKLAGDEPFAIKTHVLPLAKTIEMIKSGEIVDSRTALAILYYQSCMSK